MHVHDLKHKCRCIGCVCSALPTRTPTSLEQAGRPFKKSLGLLQANRINNIKSYVKPGHVRVRSQQLRHETTMQYIYLVPIYSAGGRPRDSSTVGSSSGHFVLVDNIALLIRCKTKMCNNKVVGAAFEHLFNIL